MMKQVIRKMRLNISFLQKTPVWVFFCFCAVVLLLAPVESHATTQIPSLGYLDNITNGFNTELQRWGETFKEAAGELFWLLVPIAMVWRFGQIAITTFSVSY